MTYTRAWADREGKGLGVEAGSFTRDDDGGRRHGRSWRGGARLKPYRADMRGIVRMSMEHPQANGGRSRISKNNVTFEGSLDLCQKLVASNSQIPRLNIVQRLNRLRCVGIKSQRLAAILGYVVESADTNS